MMIQFKDNLQIKKYNSINKNWKNLKNNNKVICKKNSQICYQINKI